MSDQELKNLVEETEALLSGEIIVDLEFDPADMGLPIDEI